MTSATKPVLTGGCQCGAVRFAVSAAPVKVSICHCRMCQKAAGAPFASFADIENGDGPRIEIMTGAFDRPDRMVPTQQFGTESRLGWVVSIANMPSQTTLQNYGSDKLHGIVSHQHPDHD
jgi:hypothetical protein